MPRPAHDHHDQPHIDNSIQNSSAPEQSEQTDKSDNTKSTGQPGKPVESDYSGKPGAEHKPHKHRQLTSPLRWIQSTTTLLLAGLAIWWLVPQVASTSWSELGTTLTNITPGHLALLLGLWATSLWAHSFTLTAGLPGLTIPQALTLKMAGSAVSNIVPCGGAVGLGLNLLMCRRWGFPNSAFAAFTVITLLWDITAKLLLPVAAVICLAANNLIPSTTYLNLAWAGCGIVTVLIATTLWSLTHNKAAVSLANCLQRLLQRVTPRRWAAHTTQTASALLTARERSKTIVTKRWSQLSIATIGYLTAQGMLMAGCLHVVGFSAAWPVFLAGFALERFLSLAFVTPSGVGISEVGTIAAFAALGADPALAAAGVLLYRMFTFILEIPVGALWIAVWWLGPAQRQRITPPVEPQAPPS